MPDLGSRPLADRLGEFKQMAADARKDAARAATREMRSGYEQLAESWEQLIREIEGHQGK